MNAFLLYLFPTGSSTSEKIDISSSKLSYNSNITNDANSNIVLCEGWFDRG